MMTEVEYSILECKVALVRLSQVLETEQENQDVREVVELASRLQSRLRALHSTVIT